MKRLEQLAKDISSLDSRKQDKGDSNEQRLAIQKMLDVHTDEMDANTVKILNMEHFIDKYVPIRIQKQVGETLQAIATASMLKKLENFEMEKFKNLNEDVLNDSDHPLDLKERAKQIQDELEKVIMEFKRKAKQKGIKYDTRTKKTNSKDGASKDELKSETSGAL
jgi:hypothetical protein